jgi:uncharacterized protein DUF4833
LCIPFDFTNTPSLRDTVVTEHLHCTFVLRHLPLSSCLLTLVAVGLVTPIARGAVDRNPRVIRSVFFVAKSENKNQVHYGIHLDEACAPAGDAPVFAYWRMLERGPFATEPLLSREVPAYGFAEQRPLKGSEQGGRVLLTLNALPKRPIIIEAAAAGGTCTTAARAAIGGIPASLTSVYVQLRWPFGVQYIALSGRASFDGHPVHERVAN